MDIKTIKQIGNNFLVNGCITIPNAVENSDYQLIQQWIKNGGIVEPEFTKQELLNNAKTKKLQELDIYQDSDTTKTITINGVYKLSIRSEIRDKMAEQLYVMELSNDGGDINKLFWDFVIDGNIIKLSYQVLKELYKKINTNIIGKNFITYQKHLNNIKNLKTIDEVEKYDFTAGYIINQNLTL